MKQMKSRIYSKTSGTTVFWNIFTIIRKILFTQRYFQSWNALLRQELIRLGVNPAHLLSW